MSDVYLIKGETLTAIADAIRSKNGTSDTISTENMASEISSLSGGSGAIVEGTAIPVGKAISEIYVNSTLTMLQVSNYLSQLTYVDIGIDAPINIIYAQTDDGENGVFVVALATNLLAGSYVVGICADTSMNGWIPLIELNMQQTDGGTDYSCIGKIVNMNMVEIYSDLPVITDLGGLPIGAENENIKNVLSITPFGTSSGTSGTSAYTVSSVDELPTNAVDGSLAIVENSDSLIGEWEWKDNTAPLDFSMFGNDYDTFTITGDDELVGVFSTVFIRTQNEIYQINFGGTLIYSSEDGWDDSYEKFTFYTDCQERATGVFTDDQFKTFIKTNCNRLSGGRSLYQRENGEWVYKCEVV